MNVLFTRKLKLGLFLVLSIFFAGHAKALPFSDLYVFGDSLVDAGNVFAFSGQTTPPAASGYFNGRFSNGPVYADVLNEAITGSRSTASLLGGNNYAWGGARALGGAAVPNLGQQVATFGANNGNVADPNALYLISIGGNDLLGGNDLGLVIGEIINQIGVLNSYGARKFLVANMPAAQVAPIVPVADKAATEAGILFYNSAFEAAINNFDMLMGAALDITIMDLFNPLVDFVANPQAFGAPAGYNTQIPCLDGALNFTGFGGTLENCLDNSAFIDAIHPTALLHSIIGTLAINSVPVPGVLVLMLTGLALLGARRKFA